MRRRDLLAAIAKQDPVEVHGTFERHTSLRWDELKASAAGGRWGARRAFEVLYLGRPRDSVIVEAYRHLVDDELDDNKALAATVLERRLVTCEVAVTNILDLRPPAARKTLALTDAALQSPVGEYAPCQAVGAAAHQLGLAGILAPAATMFGETLALFPANLVIDQQPAVIARDIWRGLPPDPALTRSRRGKLTVGVETVAMRQYWPSRKSSQSGRSRPRGLASSRHLLEAPARVSVGGTLRGS